MNDGWPLRWRVALLVSLAMAGLGALAPFSQEKSSKVSARWKAASEAHSLVPKEVDFDLSGLAEKASGTVYDAMPNDPEGPPFMNGEPERLNLTFGDDEPKDWTDYLRRQILIYPLAAYRALFKDKELLAFDQIHDNLRDLLDERPSAPRGELPVLPAWEAEQVIRARIGYLDFSHGSGVRFVSRYVQEETPVKNGELFYTFQGVTSDGKYWVSFFYPVSAKGLPETADMAKTTAFLNKLPSSDFTPNLAQLDAVVKSLRIVETAP